MKSQFYKWVGIAIVLPIWSACSGGNVGTSGSNPSSTSTAFPTALSVSSPTSTSVVASTIRSATKALSDAGETAEGDSLEDCNVDLTSLITASSERASCYGPTVDYVNHPDGAGEDGELPSGDVGLWTEVEGDGDEACAAAQLNAQFGSMEGRFNAALDGLASMLCVARNSGVGEPAAGSSVDLTEAMDGAIDSDNVTVNEATLALETDGNTNDYDYALNVTVTEDGTPYTAVITMHHSDEPGDAYQGIMNFQFNDNDATGNCGGDVTRAGSVTYDFDGDADMAVRSDSATFCKANDTPFNENGELDPTYKAEAGNEGEGGWGQTYDVFIANYDPANGSGAYSYSWQAGANDSHSRVFNISLDVAVAGTTGEAYFGYGLGVDEADFDGLIGGFICNWAGPEGEHTPEELVQHQSLNLIGNEFTATDSQISYAPTNSCAYDPGTDGAGFEYDLDGDGTIDADEIAEIGDGVDHSLLDLAEMDFTAPTPPAIF